MEIAQDHHPFGGENAARRLRTRPEGGQHRGHPTLRRHRKPVGGALRAPFQTQSQNAPSLAPATKCRRLRRPNPKPSAKAGRGRPSTSAFNASRRSSGSPATRAPPTATRPSAIGKKNWLCIGHPGASQHSAILYSLLVSCQGHSKNPLAYLTDVLRRLPALTNQSDLTPLTPAAWQPA